MYTDHFGLKHNPFDAQTAGADPFIGDRQAKAGRRIGKALSAPDAVVAVSGAVGVGKTTLVNRILQSVRADKVIVNIGRMRMGPDDVLELMLQEFELQGEPQGTIQKFASFRRLLKDLGADGKRVFVVVEDAKRIGIDALNELESLTASEGSEAPGAAIFLMGQPDLLEFLTAPELARLAQRTRVRQSVDPLTAEEVQNYIHHMLTRAGANYGALICSGVAEVLYSYSGGTPRIINNLLEATFTTAADADLHTIAPQLVAKIATDVLGLAQVQPLVMPAPPVVSQAPPQPVEPGVQSETQPAPTQPEPMPETYAPAAEAEHLPEPAPVIAEAASELSPEPEPAASQVQTKPDVEPGSRAEPEAQVVPDDATSDVAAEAAEDPKEDTAIQELPSLAELQSAVDAENEQQQFNDTDTNIPTLSDSMRIDSAALAPAAVDVEPPEPQAAARPDQEPQPEAEPDPEPVPVARFESMQAPEPELRIEDAVAAASAPTKPAPQKKERVSPDLDALEAAISVARGDKEREYDPPPGSPEPVAAKLPVPEPPQAEPLPPEPLLSEPPAPEQAQSESVPLDIPEVTLENSLAEQRAAALDLEKMAVALSKVESLEDIDDMMAETLFGSEELDAISAHIVANPPPANMDDVGLELEAEQEPQPADDDAPPKVLEPDPELMAQTEAAPIEELPDDEPEDIEITLGKESTEPARGAIQTESIEDQIDTAITQTQKVLKIADIPEAYLHEDDEDEKPSTGIFGLFKRS